MKAHRATVRRFLSFVLGIEPPKLCVHQTLTFSPPVFDPPTAKLKLKRLLDNLHKRFEMGSLYVMEDREKAGLHFHVLFLFFPENPLPCPKSRMIIGFRGEVMRAWQNLQTGKLHPQANRTTIWPTIDARYLLKAVEMVKRGDQKPASSTRWWDRWNSNLFARHRVPVDETAIRKAFESWFPALPRSKRPTLPPCSNPDYGPADMARERVFAIAFVKWLDHPQTTPDEAFDIYKRMMTEQPVRKVSDEEYVLFRKGVKPWRRKLCRDDHMGNPS